MELCYFRGGYFAIQEIPRGRTQLVSFIDFGDIYNIKVYIFLMYKELKVIPLPL
jgi:hypothetical protein